jgi:hypothetical protein
MTAGCNAAAGLGRRPTRIIAARPQDIKAYEAETSHSLRRGTLQHHYNEWSSAAEVATRDERLLKLGDFKSPEMLALYLDQFRETRTGKKKATRKALQRP